MLDGRRSRGAKRIINNQELIVKLATLIQKIDCIDHASLIAFDGVDTAGKTTLADRIHEYFISAGVDSVRISIDKFHNPKDIRLSKGEYSSDGFFYDSFDYNKIMDYIINPVKNRQSSIITGVYDYRSERQLPKKTYTISSNTVILFDGIFMNRDELYKYWDLSIFLDVAFETVIQRALLRDATVFGSEDETLKKYWERNIPGEELYLKLCNPKQRAHIVIDNNDWNQPIITKGNGI